MPAVVGNKMNESSESEPGKKTLFRPGKSLKPSVEQRKLCGDDCVDYI